MATGKRDTGVGFAGRIRGIRIRMEETQTVFAVRLGVSLRSLKIWELGNGLPHSLTAALVAKRLRMDAGTLLGMDAARVKAIHCPGIVAATRAHGASRKRVWMLATGRQKNGKERTWEAAAACSERVRVEYARRKEELRRFREAFGGKA